ncbi:MAG: ABC transporter ATP-binding protein [Chloroflexota bacterium]|nr:MAG: ABC transporter ATP-binding protein [Chloroflexota bacterium]
MSSGEQAIEVQAARLRETAPAIELSCVTKTFKKDKQIIEALQDVSLTIDKGELVAFIGPSGCGKSTVLNLVTGLVPPTAGVVRYDGQQVTQTNTRAGYMTQRDNLIPWLTVRDNIALALEIRGIKGSERKQRAAEFAQLVGVAEFERHYPAELSGGMRQRVALARTLIYQPETLLMDEPFSALDAQTRLIMQDQFLKLWEASRQTVIFVTHDLTEAIALADRLVVFSARPGRIRKEFKVPFDRPRDVFALPSNPEFSRFYGQVWSNLEVRGSL